MLVFVSVFMYVDVYLWMHVMFVWKGTAAGQRARCRPVCLCKDVRLSDEDTAEDASCFLIQHRVSACASVYFVFALVYGLDALYMCGLSACLVVCPWQRAAGI